MYEAYFGLKELPFTLSPNTQFFLNSHTHQQVLNLLNVGLSQPDGMIKIVGDAGMGKTMLCRILLNHLHASSLFVSAYVPNPYLTPEELQVAVADELGLDTSHILTRHSLVKALNEHLIRLAADGKQVVLVVDEAQAMPVKTLEALRLITNLETESRKLVQIVLFAQPKLDEMLADDGLSQFLQRITSSYRLRPLTLHETTYYLEHRLSAAGYEGRALFSASAIKHLHRASRGTPRILNVLSHKALMSAYGKGDVRITLRHVLAAAEDTEGVRKPPVYLRRLNQGRARLAEWVK
jgi:MSHA biogenesis protein MshM